MFISVGPASSFQSASLISHVPLPYLSPLTANHASFTSVPLPLQKYLHNLFLEKNMEWAPELDVRQTISVQTQNEVEWNRILRRW